MDGTKYNGASSQRYILTDATKVMMEKKTSQHLSKSKSQCRKSHLTSMPLGGPTGLKNHKHSLVPPQSLITSLLYFLSHFHPISHWPWMHIVDPVSSSFPSSLSIVIHFAFLHLLIFLTSASCPLDNPAVGVFGGCFAIPVFSPELWVQLCTGPNRWTGDISRVCPLPTTHPLTAAIASNPRP